MRYAPSQVVAAVLALGALSLGGCAVVTSSTRTLAPDGKPAFSIYCPNGAACYSEAGKLCGTQGYTIEMPKSASGAVVNNEMELWPSLWMRRDSSNNNMLIECKP